MTGPTLTPIGTSPAWYNPGEAGSGYLLEHDGYRLLLDCGSGVISSYLARYSGELPIDAVVITHAHADHVFDLVPWSYGMRVGSLQHWPTPELWLPPGAHDRLRKLVTAWDAPPNFFEQAFSVRDHQPGASHQIGPFRLTTVEVPHYVESYALRLEVEGTAIAYSGDLGPCDHLAEFIAGVDLFLCEAASPESVLDQPEIGDRGHLAPSEAGRIAHNAGAHSLLLTHVPAEHGAAEVLRAARSTYTGPVALAEAGTPYRVSARLSAAV